MATSGQGIWFPLGEGSVRDYKHAAQIFRTNDFARAPKSKYLFYVSFKINDAARANGFTSTPTPTGPNELSYLVKNVEMPKFELEVQSLNQYNRKVLVQRQIKYNPISIKFHDDNNGSLRHFWTSYYNYYYADGRDGVDFSVDDKYSGTRRSSRWGFNTDSVAPYLSYIDIYSMYHSQAQQIRIHNPLISNFSHDNHDYADGSGVLESSMTLQYTGVTYKDGIDATEGIPGFGQAAPETYDTEYSDLTSGNGLQVDPDSGELYDPTQADPSSSLYPYDTNPYLAEQTNAYNYYPSSANYITNNQLSRVLQSVTARKANAGYSFPVSNNVPFVNQDFGAVVAVGPVVFSDGIALATSGAADALYPSGSWQQSLYQRGYSTDQISSANRFLNSAKLTPQSNIQQIAEQYIRNPNSPNLLNQNLIPLYGQPATNPTRLDFNDPASSTQPVYNSQDWKTQLTNQGYTNSDISTADRYLSDLRLSPNADLTVIAANYIKYSKQNGSNTPIISVSDNTQVVISIDGPNFNPIAGDSSINPYAVI